MKILQLILVENKEYTLNSNGLFIFFHNLSDKTYNKINNYVENIYNKHTQNKISFAEKEYSKTDKIIHDYDFMSDFNDEAYASLSNKEKMFLRKKNYDEFTAKRMNDE